jgi:hypothetical protein
LPDISISESKGLWKIEPEIKDLSADDIQLLLTAWQHAQALGVDIEKTSNTKGAINIFLKGQVDPINFAIADEGDNFTLLRPDIGVSYQLPASIRNKLMTLAPAIAIDEAETPQ